MPFRASYRQHESSRDFHDQYGFQRHNPQFANVDPETFNYHGWHEMDFTTTPFNASTTISPLQHAYNQKYLAAMHTNIDSLTYPPPSNHRQNSIGSLASSSSHPQSPDVHPFSGDLYTTGPFSCAQLLNMDSGFSSMDQSNLSSSQADSDSNMLNDDNLLAVSSSVSDSLKKSPPIAELNAAGVAISRKTDPVEKICPLLAGQVNNCQPQRCGPEAPCMDFTTLPPIEECTSMPCITQSTSPNETMITSDGVSISSHQRPRVSTGSSTVATDSSSRHSSASPKDNQIQSVPLPQRRSAAAAARRRTRTATKITSTDTLASDNDEEEPGTTKPIAPSKTDAKQRAKQAHSLVERKYRENLNAKIAQLHNTLHSSHYGPSVGEEGDSDTPAASAAVPASKVRKSDVLTDAMNYVNQTEVEMRHMEHEIHRLGERVRALEKLIRCEDCSLLKQMVNLQIQAV